MSEANKEPFNGEPEAGEPPGRPAAFSGSGADALPKVYEPSRVEQRIYRVWEDGGYFRADAEAPGRSYTIVIPPPNVTERLHVGHALNNVLQDILVRWRRMQGRRTLWLPGTDHAGIATQAVVERRIFQEEKKTRHDLGREELVRRIWAWRQACGDIILQQLRRIGCSCDWTRTRFTLDPNCARAVRQTFYKMFSDGLIYRGKRLVNWDTHLQTAVADDELYHETVKGHLWHIKYPVKGEAGRFMTVATTRPETMLGDTAVAVHPGDPRYKDLIGRTAILPLLEREIPIIADGILVDPKFGSGCVKVTPAHDPNDYEAGLRHHLEMINILTPDGHINDSGGPYKGLERFTARKRVVEDLQARGLLEKVEPYQTEIGHSDRSKTPIEPYLSEQWFVRMADLAERAMQAVSDGRVKFHPERYGRTYLDWLSQKRDWCISRQLWWGHQIPIWSQDLELPADVAPTPLAGRDTDARTLTAFNRTIKGGDFFRDYLKGAGRFFLRTDEHPEKPGWIRTHFCPADENPQLQKRLEAAGWTRDADVLDTWFSSALWPFSTLGWPEETPDLKAFYPTDVLVTAREIITLWVARMVMMGLYNLGKVPFADVYIHAMIQDGEGRPMKKSLGNGVDPLDIIATHGADALRFTLAWMTTETQDVRLPVVKDPATGRNSSPKFDMGRNFCNKLWNAMRFALMNLEGAQDAAFDPRKMRLEDRWILSRVERVSRTVDQELEAFNFQASLVALYDFFWHDLCDWYLEVIKPRLSDPAARGVPQRILAYSLDRTLRLMHPFVPFVTESAWEGLAATVPDRSLPGLAAAAPSERLIVAAWPQPVEALMDEAVEKEFGRRQELIEGVRKARAESGQSASKVAVYIPEPAGQEEFIASTFDAYADLAGVTEVHVGARPAAGQVCSSAYVASLGSSVYVPMPEDMIRKERERIAREMEEKERLLAGIEGKLKNKQFVERAPAEVVRRERARAEEARAALAALEKRRAELGNG
jgi:valyl-tRNA synthetase